jgi:HSP20 family protein
MTTFRWPAGLDQFTGLRSLQRELERFLNVPSSEGYPPVNVYDTDEALVVEAFVPGVGTSEMDLSITGDTLVIKGNKPALPDVPDDHYLRRERGHGNFNRTVVLPDGVDPNNVSAKYNSGILTITLPKSAQARSHKIAVQGG